MTRIHRLVGVALGVIAFAGALTACSSDAKSTSKAVEVSAVGKLDGTDAFVGLVTSADDKVMVYVCDGASISSWIRGDVKSGRIDLTTEAGVKLSAVVADRAASGTVTLADGSTHAFKLSPSTGDAGLYRSRETTADGSGVGGWIVLADGSARGGITVGTKFTALTTRSPSALLVGHDPAPWF